MLVLEERGERFAGRHVPDSHVPSFAASDDARAIAIQREGDRGTRKLQFRDRVLTRLDVQNAHHSTHASGNEPCPVWSESDRGDIAAMADFWSDESPRFDIDDASLRVAPDGQGFVIAADGNVLG